MSGVSFVTCGVLLAVRMSHLPLEHDFHASAARPDWAAAPWSKKSNSTHATYPGTPCPYSLGWPRFAFLLSAKHLQDLFLFVSLITCV